MAARRRLARATPARRRSQPPAANSRSSAWPLIPKARNAPKFGSLGGGSFRAVPVVHRLDLQPSSDPAYNGPPPSSPPPLPGRGSTGGAGVHVALAVAGQAVGVELPVRSGTSARTAADLAA